MKLPVLKFMCGCEAKGRDESKKRGRLWVSYPAECPVHHKHLDIREEAILELERRNG